MFGKKKLISLLLCIIALSLPILSSGAMAASNDVTGINSGTTYYIKNLYDGKYLTAVSDKNGADVYTKVFNGSVAQKWRVSRITNGKYIFYANVSGSNRVLDITSSNVDIWAYNSSWNSQKFTLVRNTTSQYSGTYNIKNASSFVVLDSSNKTVVVNNSGNGSKALWSFEPVNKGDADIFTSYYKDGAFLLIFPKYFDTRGSASTFIDKCNSMKYNSSNFTNIPAKTAYNYMKNDSIWVFRGHGLSFIDKGDKTKPAATICFFKNDGGYNGYLTSNKSIVNGNDDCAVDSYNTNALSKVQCVLYIGCSTGISYNGHNLVDSTFEKGAHFVLGTKIPVITSHADGWTKKFFEKADTGASIRQCINFANYYEDIGSLYFRGDTYTKLK